MSQKRRPTLYSSRLVVLAERHGRWYLCSLLGETGVPLYPATRAFISALWDRADRRPLADRLCAPGVPDGPFRGQLLQQLVDAKLVVDVAVDESGLWRQLAASRLAEQPLIDEVELTNACPFTCPFCPRGRGEMTRAVGHMDLGLLAAIADQVKGRPSFKPFGLHHFGDPLLHPRAIEAVRLVRERGLTPEISVNPILLTEAKARGLLSAGVGVLIVSMDGLDTPTLAAMRGEAAGRAATVDANVERLIDLAQKMSSPPDVIISMVATTLNRQHWSALFARYRRPALPWLKPVVRALNTFGDDAIARLSVVPLRQLCGSPYRLVSVLWDGTVVPCCHDFDGRTPLGDLRTQTLDQVWHGEAMRRFRERWQRQVFDDGEPCARCHWRVDRYVAASSIAMVDAWTESLWPEPLPSTGKGPP
jgi:radical SAM protein with 4Fe4S-binding SPASM domain